MITLTARDKEMLKMWDRGATSSELANHFGLTRSAVMGRLSRLRAAGHVGYKTKAPPIYRIPKLPPAAPVNKKPHKTAKQKQAEIKALVHQRLQEKLLKHGFSLMELGPDMCRYAIKGDRPPEYRFCGKPTYKNSYCEEHHNLCWIPVEKRERNKKSAFLLKKV